MSDDEEKVLFAKNGRDPGFLMRFKKTLTDNNNPG